MRRRRFDRRPEEVAAVRRFVGSGLARGSEAWETAQLLVSETVTSALDQSPPSPGSGTLVEALASRWGVRESSAGRTIWFEVDLTAG
jgi:hypothetical protein